eukprot:201836-Amorphochlora_amoeboformis.AAC.1
MGGVLLAAFGSDAVRTTGVVRGLETPEVPEAPEALVAGRLQLFISPKYSTHTKAWLARDT